MIGFKSYVGFIRSAAKLRLKARALRRGQSGSALVEFALSAAILVTMLFGVIEFGYALYTYQFVNEVARELTRYAIVRGTACTAMPNCNFNDTGSTLQTYARGAFTYPGMNMNNLTVTDKFYSPVKNANGTISSWSLCGSGSTCNKPGYMVQVNVTYPFVVTIPFVPKRSMSVASSSSMVISQ